MNKKFKYKNTIVIGFDDIDNPKREEIMHLLSQGVAEDWCLFTAAYDVLDDKDVSIDDQFRDIADGEVVKVLEAGYSFENGKPFAVCTDENLHEPQVTIKYLDELLDIRRWAKMNQYKESNNG